MAFIYKITNNINGKAYIGKTESTVEKRFKQHCQDYKKDRCSNRPLYRAMNKYGVENFTVEVIEETFEPNTREIYWIEYFNTYKFGYNATKGGDGKSYVDVDLIITCYLENKTIKAVSKLTGYDQATISNVLNNNLIQRFPTKSRKEVSALDENNNIVMTFESCRAASRYFIEQLNLNSKNESGYAGHIAACCNGKRKTAFNFKWKYNCE